jgi:hypothetical protein
VSRTAGKHNRAISADHRDVLQLYQPFTIAMPLSPGLRLRALGRTTMEAHARRDEFTVIADEAFDAPPIVSFDERRMHIRAYNYWASLLNERNLPSIEDLNPSEIEDFGSHSVLLDFTNGVDDPAIAFMGSALASQCDVAMPIDRISQVPARTLLSRLTDHYLQIIANAAPIGFEAEFTNQRDNEILYRGIMMPFSSNDDKIDFVYGVINWKEVANDTLSDMIAAEVQAAHQPAALATDPARMWSGNAIHLDDSDDDFSDFGDDDGARDEDALELSESDMLVEMPGHNASLDDCLAAAREAADRATASEGRTRHALYRAIGLAHAFAVAAQARPNDYAEILADAGLIAQPRSPMTALAKLVFGASYDKTRLAEFVCAIDHALAQDMAPGALIDHLHALPGGLKALVANARATKRGKAAVLTATTARARSVLTQAAPITADSLAIDDNGLAIVVMRREADGSLSMIASLPENGQLAERVFSAAAKNR